MFRWFRNKCSPCPNHKWYKTVERSEIVSVPELDDYYVDFVYAFCPECRRRLKVSRDEWELICAEQEIMEYYKGKFDEGK